MRAEPKAAGTLPEYLPGWLPDADGLLEWCLASVAWSRESLHLAGRRVPVPRLVAWFGDAGLNYRYSGCDHPATTWPARLVRIRRRLEAEVGLGCNYVLLNLYRDGNDWMGWHTDNESGLGRTVGSLSLGAIRRFRVRRPDGDHVFDVEHGSLLLLDGNDPHTLARTRRPVAPRVNLTFRRLAPAAQNAGAGAGSTCPH